MARAANRGAGLDRPTRSGSVRVNGQMGEGGSASGGSGRVRQNGAPREGAGLGSDTIRGPLEGGTTMRKGASRKGSVTG